MVEQKPAQLNGDETSALAEVIVGGNCRNELLLTLMEGMHELTVEVKRLKSEMYREFATRAPRATTKARQVGRVPWRY